MNNAESCPRFGKWMKGCTFEGRYDKGPADANLDLRASTYEQLAGIIEKTRKVVYVRDICTTCGKTIERKTRS